MSERWLTPDEACAFIKRRVDVSVGRSEAILGAARKSGEVRAEKLFVLNDDGLVGMNLRSGGQKKPGISADGKLIEHTLRSDGGRLNESDLLDWLDRQYPPTTEPTAAASTRYPADTTLIEEGRRMLASGMQKRAIARKLAERAEGAGTFESKVDRLRRLL
jgi:hypothetical protein